MRIATLFDIHGNIPALEAVLSDIGQRGVDTVVVGGDVVPGPFVKEAFDILSNLDARTLFIHGNGETDVLVARDGREPMRVPERYRDAIRFSAESLTVEQIQAIRTWPRTVTLDVEKLGRVLFCHATPRDDNEVFTKDTPEDALVPLFPPSQCTIVVCGHTHMQFDRDVGAVRVLNSGSVGMPFGHTGAFWTLLDGSGVHLQRTTYDVRSAAERIRASPFPGADEFASACINPPTEEAMLSAFNRVALSAGTSTTQSLR
jgi:predicted phosphodiesterase